MDNLGAIGGPLLASLLVALVGVRSAMLLSVIPGLLATLAIFYAIRATRHATRQERRKLRIQLRPVLKGDLGRFFIGIGAFEVGNVAATFLILRAVQLLTPTHGSDSATQIGIWLYIGYNAVAAAVSIPGGKLGDHKGNLLVLTLGAVGVRCVVRGAGAHRPADRAPGRVLLHRRAGHRVRGDSRERRRRSLSEEQVRGSAFGALATIQSLGNFAASAIAGVLYTVVSPRAAFLYLAVWMVVAVIAFVGVHVRPANPPRQSGSEALG